MTTRRTKMGNNKEKTNNDILKHGYQPTRETGTAIGGYQPKGGDNQSGNTSDSSTAIPPSGGSAQQDD